MRGRPGASPDVYLWACAFLFGVQLAVLAHAQAALSAQRRRYQGMLRDAGQVLEQLGDKPERIFVAPAAPSEPPKWQCGAPTPPRDGLADERCTMPKGHPGAHEVIGSGRAWADS